MTKTSLSARLGRSRISIRRATLTSDGSGGQLAGWTPIATGIPAEVLSLNGREALIAGALQGVSSFSITIRWRDGVQVDDQVRLGDGRELNIRSAEDPDARRERLVILADTGSVTAT